MNPGTNCGAVSSVTIAGRSRRRFAALALILTILGVAACGTRPENGYLQPVTASAPGATDHTLLVATTRERDDRPGTYFNGERSPLLSYAEFTVSIPPNHVPSQMQLASSPPGDPATDFVVRDAALLDGDRAFLARLNAQLALRPRGERNVFIFVHGFNTTFAEGVFTTAQLAHDSRTQGVPLLFTWASRGRPTQYVYDTNSATAARDALVHTLRLALASNAEKVNILAHSLGNWVTVEALRQMELTSGVDRSGKLGLVILSSPDIDIDVFESQLRTIGTKHPPFFVVLSQHDRALALSNFIAGGQTRVGNASDAEQLTALGATVVDLSDVSTNDSFNHDQFAQLARVAPELREVLANGIQINPGYEGPIAGPGEALMAVLGAPVRILAGQ